MRLSASQLADYDRCGLQYAYRRDPSKLRVQHSAAAYGTVVHHALNVLEREWSTPNGEIDTAALARAIATFTYYWHPAHIGELTEPIQEWQRGQDWVGLAERGPRVLAEYAEVRAKDDAIVLALEYPFEVPVIGTEHTLSGYIDKLAVRRYSRKPYLSADDFKTGKTRSWLRHDVQGHAYCYATTRPEFWTPFGENSEEVWANYEPLSRRFRWVSLSDNKYVDSWRGEQDWRRLALMVNMVARAVENGIYVPTLDGSTCSYCDFQNICGDVPLPSEDHGRPALYGGVR